MTKSRYSQLVQNMARPGVVLAFAVLGVVAFWSGYIRIYQVQTYYGLQEVVFFRRTGFLGIFDVMDFGVYQRFSPLGLGLIGYLDFNLLVPLLRRSSDSDASLALAGRLTFLHPLLLAVTCSAGAFVTWRLTRNIAFSILTVVLLGFNDAVPFQFRFVSTLACYILQTAAIFCFYFMVKPGLANWKGVCGALLCIAISLGAWEQGLSLAIAAAVFLMVAVYMRRKNIWMDLAERPGYLLSGILVVVGLYLSLRVGAGAGEALSPNREASYFFSYKNPLLMFDDLILNFSGLAGQLIRQLFPFPSQSFAVLLNVDMNTLNPYNTKYSQYPNMPYRMMSLWFSGFSFAFFVALICLSVCIAAYSSAHTRRWIVFSCCIMLFGFAMHLPIMQRDYFYIPGYTLGYKASVAYIGFVYVIVYLAKALFETKMVLGMGVATKTRATSYFLIYLVLAAIVRALAVQIPKRYPW